MKNIITFVLLSLSVSTQAFELNNTVDLLEYKIDKNTIDDFKVKYENKSVSINNLIINHNVNLNDFDNANIQKIEIKKFGAILKYPEKNSKLCKRIIFDSLKIENKTKIDYKTRLKYNCLIAKL